jgi:hypothetical protein
VPLTKPLLCLGFAALQAVDEEHVEEADMGYPERKTLRLHETGASPHTQAAFADLAKKQEAAVAQDRNAGCRVATANSSG